MLKKIGFCWIFFITSVFANNALILQEIIKKREVQAVTHVTNFEEKHHFVFFFASTCPHCHNFAPVLKKWTDSHHYQVGAYSFDGQPLPEFSQVLKPDNILLQAAFQNETIRYPALFLVNNQTGNLYPVAIGELQEAELDERLQHLIPKVMTYERGLA